MGHSDTYLRAVLTIIAGALVALALRAGLWSSTAGAATPVKCEGQMSATGAGPVQASLGASYKIEVTCR